MAPELLQGEPYGEKVDVWALGCILHELITLKPAFTGSNEDKLKYAITEGAIPALIKRDVGQGLRQIYYMCMTKNPEKRPDILSILRVPEA